MFSFARLLLIIGLVLVAIGGLLYLAARVNLPLGRLPGDFRIQGQNFTCLIPLATSIILSILLTVVLNLLARLFGGK